VSLTDPPVDDTQPEGQGDVGESGNPVYAEYLDRIPEDAREVAEEAFRDWDTRTQQRFQEAADFRKQWEPLAQTGISDLSAEEVAWLVQFRGALEDPQVMQQWWNGYAEQNGLAAAPPEQQQTLDEYGGYQDQAAIEALVEQRLGPVVQALEQFNERFVQQDQQAAEAQAMQYIEGQLAELEQKHGADFNREMVELFTTRHIDADPMNAVPKAWADWQKVRNGIEKAAMQPKLEAPPPAEGGGVPDTMPPKLDTFRDAEATAKEMLRNMNRA
jgi:hypothetical protein